MTQTTTVAQTATDLEFFKTYGTWFGIAVSLLWNIYNTWNTGRYNKKKNTRDSKISEFNTIVRGPILAYLTSINSVKNSCKAIFYSSDISGSTESLRKIQREEFQPIVDRLREAATTAEAHQMFATEIKLSEIIEEHFDKILEAFQRAYGCGDVIADLQPAVSRISEAIEALKLAVSVHLSGLVTRYAQ